MTIRCTDPGAYNQALADELELVTRRFIESGSYVLGPELDSFEQEFATFVEADHCVGVGSGLDALVLGLRALGVGEGDEVIVPSHTFVGTWLAVEAVGAEPVGVEPDPSSLLIDPSLLDAARTRRTKAVVPVHLHGHPADMDRILDWADHHDVLVLCDAAQAHGARFDGRGIGGLGSAVAWSFYPTKNLGALGDGGAVTCDNVEVAERLRVLRNYGYGAPNRCDVLGVNSRLDELQAALLRVKLQHVERWNQARRDQAARYLGSLADVDIGVPAVVENVTPVWHHFVIKCTDRDRIRTRLANGGVETLVHYPIPAFDQPAFAGRRRGGDPYPLARVLATEVLSLPIGLHLSAGDQDRVIELLHPS